MENSDAENGASNKSTVRRKGGLMTMPFIIANETFEKIASYGLQPNMILYLTTMYHFSVASGMSILFVWGAISNFLPIMGAFLSDSYFGRFRVISGGTLTTLMGLVLIWLTSIIKDTRPPHCDLRLNNCIKPRADQMALLFMALGLMSIGAGGVRPCSIAFGADQFDDPKNPKNRRILQSFFNWYYASLGVSLMIAVTVIVYIQTEFGWVIGFGVPVGLMFVSLIMFFLGSRLYVKLKPNQSLLTGLVQVIVASWRNRHIVMAPDEQKYHHSKDSKHIAPTDELRFLNKACIIWNAEKDLNPDGSASDPWRLCNVLQVQVLKLLIKLLPIWSSGIVIAITLSQHAFPVLQASTLDRRLIGSFEIPAGSFGLFGIVTFTIWIVIYDRILVPLLAKYTKNPRGIGVKTRIGLGLLLSCISTATTALVEQTRRNRAIHEGLADNPRAQVNMSAAWVIPQHCITGLAEAFNAIGLIELFYSEFPKSMGSVAVALFSMTMAIGNLIAALIVFIVDGATKRGGRESWVSNNLNKGHYDYYFWVLCALSVLNLVYYILCSRAYKCRDRNEVWEEEEEDVGNEEAKTRESAMVDMHISKDSQPSEYFST